MLTQVNESSLILVIGGARSGKSLYAENLASSYDHELIYLATAEPRDIEMKQRIQDHQSRRGRRWKTIEEPIHLATALQLNCKLNTFVLVDCLTLWLSNIMARANNFASEMKDLIVTLQHVEGRVVLVSNEVGLGIVPDNELARKFRDQAGLLNQSIASIADEVFLLSAGLPIKIKP